VDVRYRPGKDNQAADGISRQFTGLPKVLGDGHNWTVLVHKHGPIARHVSDHNHSGTWETTNQVCRGTNVHIHPGCIVGTGPWEEPSRPTESPISSMGLH